MSSHAVTLTLDADSYDYYLKNKRQLCLSAILQNRLYELQFGESDMKRIADSLDDIKTFLMRKKTIGAD